MIGPRLQRVGLVDPQLKLPVTVSTDEDVDALVALCLVEAGAAPAPSQMAWASGALTGRGPGQHLHAFMQLTLGQIASLSDAGAHVELAL